MPIGTGVRNQWWLHRECSMLWRRLQLYWGIQTGQHWTVSSFYFKACFEYHDFYFLPFFIFCPLFHRRCVPSGYCGGTFCAKNAVCLSDSVQSVQYCSCPENYVGDGLTNCTYVPPTCDVINNCGLDARCVPNANGTYECVCNPGFEGNGFDCTPEKNCYNIPSLCHEFGRCISTRTGYQCICNSGKLLLIDFDWIFQHNLDWIRKNYSPPRRLGNNSRHLFALCVFM